MNKHEAFWGALEKTAGWKIPKDIFKRGPGGIRKAIKTTGVVKKVGDAVSKITTRAKPYAQTVKTFNSMR